MKIPSKFMSGVLYTFMIIYGILYCYKSNDPISMLYFGIGWLGLDLMNVNVK